MCLSVSEGMEGGGLMDLPTVCVVAVSGRCIQFREYARPFGLVFCIRGMWVSDSVFSFLDREFTSVDM